MGQVPHLPHHHTPLSVLPSPVRAQAHNLRRPLKLPTLTMLVFQGTCLPFPPVHKCLSGKSNSTLRPQLGWTQQVLSDHI